MKTLNNIFATSFLVVLVCPVAISADDTAVKAKAVTFEEVTEKVGLTTQATWKYGGPSIADLNGDGVYELMLSNHHRVPAQLFWGSASGDYKEHDSVLMKNDVHGIAPGDFDNDGDADLLISLGGGNGTKPQPPRLLRNDDGQFIDITDKSGIGGMGARGRSVRWVDLDGDQDLDMLQINAPVTIDEEIPRNIMHENLGDGKFRYVPNSQFESIDAERVLITDFNNDHVPDLVCFTPLSLWQGVGKFKFENVTESLLPKSLQDTEYVMAVADLDFDNDGDLDLYMARGKTYYELANNSVSFEEKSGRLDLRDAGSKSHDGISFRAKGNIQLLDFFRWYRGIDFDPKVFIGASKTPIEAPLEAATISQKQAKGFPDSIQKNGWYLGYLGEDEWRLEWLLNGDIAWGLRASIMGVDSVQPDWTPQDSNVADLLLLNQGASFSDASELLPEESEGNNWGVTVGDFNNDSWSDLFIYRFGDLNKRFADALLINERGVAIRSELEHNAINKTAPKSHGDMGAAFDYDMDGRVDILSGDDDQGAWHLYRNVAKEIGNYALIRVGYSKQKSDAIGAELWLETDNKTLYRRIGSPGATHSQSVLNTVHFGLGKDTKIRRIKIRWRDGYEEIIENLEVNTHFVVGVSL